MTHSLERDASMFCTMQRSRSWRGLGESTHCPGYNQQRHAYRYCFRPLSRLRKSLAPPLTHTHSRRYTKSVCGHHSWLWSLMPHSSPCGLTVIGTPGTLALRHFFIHPKYCTVQLYISMCFTRCPVPYLIMPMFSFNLWLCFSRNFTPIAPTFTAVIILQTKLLSTLRISLYAVF